jgi:hypothetical protein
MLAALLPLGLLAAAMLLLPVLGALLSGQTLGEILVFPLAARSWDPLPLDPNRFALFCLALAIWLLGSLWLAWPRRPVAATASGGAQKVLPDLASSHWTFPRWGIWGALSVGAAVAAALANLPGLSQPLLVTGLTLLLAADSERRSGSSLVGTRPGYLLLLYPASALLGWLFHWLNIFLQLWTYPGADSAIETVLARTLDYATLLPALMVMRQWLSGWGPLLRVLGSARPLDVTYGPGGGWAFVAGACAALCGAGVWPDWIWAPAWIAPLLLVLGMQKVAGRPSLLAGPDRGDWSGIALPGISALILGLAIQGWNTLAGPVWTFSLPLVDAMRVFGLPLPAYAGLVPLGILGVWVAQRLAHPWRRGPHRRLPELPVRIGIGS